MCGARFDIAYYSAKEQIGELMGWGTKNVTAVVEKVVVHEEL